MFEDLDSNFKKNAVKPIQTDVKKMDTREDSFSDEPKEQYEKKFESNQMSGLLSLFENKLRERSTQHNDESSSDEFDTIDLTSKNVVVTTTTPNNEVSEKQIESLMNPSVENIVKITSVNEKNKVNINKTTTTEPISVPKQKIYEESAGGVDPTENLRIHKENSNPIARYEESRDIVDPHNNLQQINYSGSTSLSNAIGQGNESHQISDEEINRHLEEHNRKKQEEAEEKRLNSVVEVPEEQRT